MAKRIQRGYGARRQHFLSGTSKRHPIPWEKRDGRLGKVKREALYSENDEICSIGKRAYDALRNGASPEETKAAYDAEKDAFIERHMWD